MAPTALGREWWPADAYDRADLPERVLMFGTGMLLRALVATAVDDANRAGAFHGGVVALQSTANGCAPALTRQHGLFTLVERGFSAGAPVERTRLVGSITRGLVAADDWPAARDLVARPELRVIVSNVTEAGLCLDDRDVYGGDPNAVPVSFPGKLTDLLHTRFQRSPDAPPMSVIPAELIPDNGPRLRELVHAMVGRHKYGREFHDWIARRVRFASSLVDRITTGRPAAADHAALSARLGYSDEILTVTEPDALWAVETDSDALRQSFPINDGTRMIFARDISFYRDRKLRLLNAAHTALAPLALLSGIATVRAATQHAQLGPLWRHMLFEELVPGSGVPRDDATAYAQTVWDRFANPWLEHQWSTIATNQREKTRIRVIPSIVEFCAQRGRVPQGLALALAAHVRFLNLDPHALGHAAEWSADLTAIPGLVDATARWLAAIDRDGVASAIGALLNAPRSTEASSR